MIVATIGSMRASGENTVRHGFTLIEMAIVIIIIGLIVGGIMVGQTLISAATVRAQATQIEKYHQAVNTFREKYGYLPGDMPQTASSNLDLPPRQHVVEEGMGMVF